MNEKRQKQIPGYLYVLDGMRAISLIMIVVLHTWQKSSIFFTIRLNSYKYLLNLEPFQRCGYVAVDFFYILSGFCLFYPIARDMFGESKFGGWKQFFIKRARRIYPSYIILIAVCLIFPVFSAGGYDASSPLDVIKHVIAHLLFIHTWSTKTLGSIISVAWTMGMEVQFYVLFPLICIPFRKKPVLMFAAMALFSTALRLWFVMTGDMNNMLIHTFTPVYFDIFGCGMISAYFVVYMRNRVKCYDKLKPFMTAISMVCIFLAIEYFYWIRAMDFPQGVNNNGYFRFLYRGLLAAVIGGFLFSACFSYDFWEKKIWGNKFFVFLSQISYTVYLWHYNILDFLRKINIPYTRMEFPQDDRAAMDGMVFIAWTAAVIIGVIITRYIEAPIIKYGYSGCFKRIMKIVIPKKIKNMKG